MKALDSQTGALDSILGMMAKRKQNPEEMDTSIQKRHDDGIQKSWKICNESFEGSSFQIVPTEIIIIICRYIKSLVDIIRLSKVCCGFYRIGSPIALQMDRSLWKISAWSHITELSFIGCEKSLKSTDILNILRGTNGQIKKLYLGPFYMNYDHVTQQDLTTFKPKIAPRSAFTELVQNLFVSQILYACPTLEVLRLTSLYVSVVHLYYMVCAFKYSLSDAKVKKLSVPLRSLKLFYCTVQHWQEEWISPTNNLPSVTSLQLHKCFNYDMNSGSVKNVKKLKIWGEPRAKNDFPTPNSQLKHETFQLNDMPRRFDMPWITPTAMQLEAHKISLRRMKNAAVWNPERVTHLVT